MVVKVPIKDPLVYRKASTVQYEWAGKSAGSFEKIADLLNKLTKDCPVEIAWVVALDSAHKIISIQPSSVGTPSQAAVMPQSIMRFLIVECATAFIFCHNHPSGELAPSYQDKELTRALSQAGAAVQIRFLDHFIVDGKGKHFSFRKEGLL